MNGTCWKNDATWQAYLWFDREERRWKDKAQDCYEETEGEEGDRMNEARAYLAEQLQYHLEDDNPALFLQDKVIDYLSIAAVFCESIITDED